MSFNTLIKKTCKPILQNEFRSPATLGAGWVCYGHSIDEFLGYYLIFRNPRTGDLIAEICVAPITSPDDGLKGGLAAPLQILLSPSVDPDAVRAAAHVAVRMKSRIPTLAQVVYQQLEPLGNDPQKCVRARRSLIMSHKKLGPAIRDLIGTRSAANKTNQAISRLVEIALADAALADCWAEVPVDVRSDIVEHQIWDIVYGYRFVGSQPIESGKGVARG